MSNWKSEMYQSSIWILVFERWKRIVGRVLRRRGPYESVWDVLDTLSCPFLLLLAGFLLVRPLYLRRTPGELCVQRQVGMGHHDHPIRPYLFRRCLQPKYCHRREVCFSDRLCQLSEPINRRFSCFDWQSIGPHHLFTSDEYIWIKTIRFIN